jgi:hypothetical protein
MTGNLSAAGRTVPMLQRRCRDGSSVMMTMFAVRCENRGELVGGFGDVVRSQEELGDVLSLAAEFRHQAAARGQGIKFNEDVPECTQQDADYLDGIVATLSWILGERLDSPITRSPSREVTTRVLKLERVHAEDTINHAKLHWTAGRLPPRDYGEGVAHSISWLLGI